MNDPPANQHNYATANTISVSMNFKIMAKIDIKYTFRAGAMLL